MIFECWLLPWSVYTNVKNEKSLQDMQQHLIFPDIKLLAMQLCMSGSTTYLLDLFE